MDVQIKCAVTEDAKRLAEVFNLSFYSDYLKYGECPGYGKTERDMLLKMLGYRETKKYMDNNVLVSYFERFK